MPQPPSSRRVTPSAVTPSDAPQGVRTISLDGMATPSTSSGSSAIVVRRGLGMVARPTRLRFSLIDELGRGGMGVVLRGRDPDLQREVAIKLLRANDDPVRQARFFTEAQINGQLEHPNIVPVHESGLDQDGRPWFAMKLVRGREMSEVLGERREHPAAAAAWPLVRLVGVLIQVCNGMAFAHSKNVIHRDLKPGNVMLGDFGEVLVMDWGLGKVLVDEVGEDGRDSGSSALTSSPVVTLDGAVVGTPCYMPPEQARGDLDLVGVPSDVYALGAILYEILTGQPPVTGDSVEEVVRKVRAHEIARPLRDVAGRRVPRELAAVAMRALAADPADRYPGAAALGDDLQAWLDHRSVSAVEGSLLGALIKLVRRHRLTTAVLVLALVAIATSVAVGWAGKEEQRREAVAARAVSEAERQRAEDALLAAEARRLQLDSGRRREQNLIGNAERLGHRSARGLALAAIGQADAALARGDAEAALRCLDAAPVDQRDWCWRHLHALALGRGLAAVRATGEAPAARVLPAGDGFALISGDGRVRWHDGSGGALQRVDLGREVIAADADPGGRRLAVALAGGGVRVLDGSSGQRRADLLGLVVPGALALADGAIVLATPMAVRVVATGQGGGIRTEAVPGAIALATGHEQGWLAAAPASGGIVLSGPGLARTLATPEPATLLVASGDGRTLVAACGAVVLAWEMPGTAAPARYLIGTPARAMALDRSGTLLAVAGMDGAVVVWDLEVGMPSLRLPTTTARAVGLAWAPDGRTLGVLRADGSCELRGEF